jgi:hypothetical protein
MNDLHTLELIPVAEWVFLLAAVSQGWESVSRERQNRARRQSRRGIRASYQWREQLWGPLLTHLWVRPGREYEAMIR